MTKEQAVQLQEMIANGKNVVLIENNEKDGILISPIHYVTFEHGGYFIHTFHKGYWSNDKRSFTAAQPARFVEWQDIRLIEDILNLNPPNLS